MVKCPMRFEHPSEASRLNGIGDKLCGRLTEELTKYCEEHGLPPSRKKKGAAKRFSEAMEPQEEAGEDQEDQQLAPKRRKTVKLYVPALRSGAYAIVIALATLPRDRAKGMLKSELVDKAQDHCDSSFTIPSDPTKFYTAWKSMDTLKKKDLVCELGLKSAPRYMLTEEGWECADRIEAGETERSTFSGRAISQREGPTEWNPADDRYRQGNTTRSDSISQALPSLDSDVYKNGRSNTQLRNVPEVSSHHCRSGSTAHGRLSALPDLISDRYRQGRSTAGSTQLSSPPSSFQLPVLPALSSDLYRNGRPAQSSGRGFLPSGRIHTASVKASAQNHQLG